MKNGIRFSCIVLLVSNGLAAIIGGIFLMTDPTGKLLQLPGDWLSKIPFESYLIPGLFLFIVIGAGNLLTAALVLLRHIRSSAFTILQGCILAGWIIAQVYWLQTVSPLHIVFGGIGFALFTLGMIMADDEAVIGQDDFF